MKKKNQSQGFLGNIAYSEHLMLSTIFDIYCSMLFWNTSLAKWKTERIFKCVVLKNLHVCVSQQQYLHTFISIVCVCVYPCPFAFTAVISAHPIHSLDNHHHHYHMGSLASPTRSYLYHQGSGHLRPHACATPVSHLDRVDSTGETLPHAGRQENCSREQRSQTWSYSFSSFIHSLIICSLILLQETSCFIHIVVS